MSATDGAFAQWLSQAQIAEDRLTAEQRGLLQYAFAFRERCGDDYYSSRLLSHFLLHCESGLKVAQIARLVGISRPTASHQQGVSSGVEAIQEVRTTAWRAGRTATSCHAMPVPSPSSILTYADATLRCSRFHRMPHLERGRCRRLPCTTFARSSAWIGPRVPEAAAAPAQRGSVPPRRAAASGETMPRKPARATAAALPFFLDADAIRVGRSS